MVATLTLVNPVPKPNRSECSHRFFADQPKTPSVTSLGHPASNDAKPSFNRKLSAS